MSDVTPEPSAEVPPEGTPLPSGAIIFRLFESNDGKMMARSFELSTRDKELPNPRLSTWERSRTTLVQAAGLTTKPYSHAGLLFVDGVRALTAPLNGPAISLDVEWERHRDHDGQVVDLPGADGHCGITNLKRPSGVPKNVFRSIRASLARLANERGTVPVGRAS